MAPFVKLVKDAGLPVTVVDTHADWDHAWGNAAFPDAPIVAHSACHRRLRSREAREELARKRRELPGMFDGVRLVPPTATFDVRMTLDLGGLDVELRSLPGHTEDSIVAYVANRQLVFGGDCIEDPFPLLESGPLLAWAAELRGLAALGVRTVVPAHGAIGGPELLLGNAAYLESLPSRPALAAGLPSFYAGAHARNVVKALALHQEG
jgi:glyoxylase-like metal-dependent hydrolase (beta-lactamase superfamily II)